MTASHNKAIEEISTQSDTSVLAVAQHGAKAVTMIDTACDQATAQANKAVRDLTELSKTTSSSVMAEGTKAINQVTAGGEKEIKRVTTQADEAVAGAKTVVDGIVEKMQGEGKTAATRLEAEVNRLGTAVNLQVAQVRSSKAMETYTRQRQASRTASATALTP